MALELNVLSKRGITDDPVTWVTGVFRIGEIEVESVADMATKVVAVCQSQAATAESAVIGRLNLMDHSVTNDGKTVSGFQMGRDVITESNVAEFQTSLRKIHYRMASRGFVHLMHCQIGKNELLLKRLAAIFGVEVYAGTGDHNPLFRFNFGDYVVCTPEGRIKRNVPRPSMR